MKFAAAILLDFFLIVALSSVAAAAQDREKALDYRLEISFDLPEQAITGTARISAMKGQDIRLDTGRLSITALTFNNAPLQQSADQGILAISPAEDGELLIRYTAVFSGRPRGSTDDAPPSDIVGPQGIALTGLWYPRPAQLARYQVTARLPKGFTAISSAEGVETTSAAGGVEFRFHSSHPAEGVILAASERYEVVAERADGIEFAVYLPRDDRKRAGSLIAAMREQVARYRSMLGQYPFARFAMAEGVLSTDVSSPALLLLRAGTMRSPAAIDSSLRQETPRQWLGNALFCDAGKGNWVEGLVSYLAGTDATERPDAGWERRKRIMQELTLAANTKQAASLKAYRGQEPRLVREAAKGRTELLLHQVRKYAGNDPFFTALRTLFAEYRFRRTSWDHLQLVFGQHAGAAAAAIIQQGLESPSLPDIRIAKASSRRSGSGYELTLEVQSKGLNNFVELPLSISYPGGAARKDRMVLNAEVTRASFTAPEEPAVAVLDEDYDAPRRLSDDELPPVIGALLSEETPLIVLPAENKEIYAPVLDYFRKQGAVVRDPGSVKDEDVRSRSVVVLGRNNPVLKQWYGAGEPDVRGFGITVKRNPWNPAKAVGVIQTDGEHAAAVDRIGLLGGFTRIVFYKGAFVTQETAPSDRGMIMEFREEPPVVDLSALTSVAQVVSRAATKKIVYVGEYHDRFSHHDMQLRIVRELYARNRAVAIGMEMFQRPFQKTLDEYIAGAIDEREFLKRSEYFKRWGFDYNLYKPILDFARAERIPVVALNMKREIIEKVSKGGIDSLTAEERKELPAEMDMVDETYRDRLKRTFEQHETSGSRRFDYFLQAQVLWDETMAWSIDEYLAAHPERQMIVIAGGGHVAYGAGIPKRSHRRNGLPYTIILNDVEVEAGIADYIIFPRSLDGVTAPKLMATFTEREGRLFFNDFIKDSPARRAGVRAGDVLLSLDGAPVATMNDVRIALFYKNKDEALRIVVRRKRFLLGERELTFDVKL